jgi:hypothetical protein
MRGQNHYYLSHRLYIVSKELFRAYTKDFRGGRTHIRLERQECPRTSLACAIEEKLNSASTRTWSAPYRSLSNGPQYELAGKSSASFNSKDENSQKSASCDRRPYHDKNIDESASDQGRYVEVDEQELESQYIEVPKSRTCCYD